MKTLDLIQGTPEWAAHRAAHRNASDAAPMMGDGKHMTRNKLMTLLKSGPKEVSKWVQENLYDKGHEAEANARPIIEELIGEELYPVTGVSEEHPLLSASFDGLTMAETISFEHKDWNEELAAMIRAKELSPAYYWQLEQQLLVSGAEKVIFVTSNGTREKMEYMEYFAVPGRAQQLVAGWKQFEIDLANYKPPVEAAEVEGRAPETLPALNVEVSGLVKCSNIAEFKATALKVVASLNTDLNDDQDFADAAEGIKWCDDLETNIDTVKARLINQTASLAEIYTALDEIKASSAKKRISLTNTIKARKDKIKADMVTQATADFRAHVDAINAALVKVSLPTIPANFTESLKNKRTNASLQNAIDTELARVKIKATEIGEKYAARLLIIEEQDSEYAGLFNDLSLLVAKETDDLQAVIHSRIATHKAEQEKIAERNRIAEAARVAALAVQEEAPIVIAQTQPAGSTPGSLQPQPPLNQQPEQPAAVSTVANGAVDLTQANGPAPASKVTYIGGGGSRKTATVIADSEIIAAVAQRFGWTTRVAVVRLAAIPFNDVLNNLQEHA